MNIGISIRDQKSGKAEATNKYLVISFSKEIINKVGLRHRDPISVSFTDSEIILKLDSKDGYVRKLARGSRNGDYCLHANLRAVDLDLVNEHDRVISDDFYVDDDGALHIPIPDSFFSKSKGFKPLAAFQQNLALGFKAIKGSGGES